MMKKDKPEKDKLKKNFDVLNANKFVASKGQTKEDIVKALVDNYFGTLNSNNLFKSIDQGKLVKKQVTIHGHNGKVYTGFRWVDPTSGMPAQSPRESKTNIEAKQKHIASAKGDEVKENAGLEKRFNEIVSGKDKWNSKVRDLIGLGIYDPTIILQAVPEVESVGKFAAYCKEAGISLTKLNKTLENNINELLGNKVKTTDEAGNKLSISALQEQGLRRKDVFGEAKVRKQERAKEENAKAEDKMDYYKLQLEQVIVDRLSRSVVAYGTGGIGKTYNCEKVLEAAGKVGWDPELELEPSEYDYVKITGHTTPSDMYQLLYENPKKLIIFDDCDDMWDDQDMANMLKGALDTTGNNMISYPNPKKLPDGTKPPPRFKFSGQIIFISNLSREELTKKAGPIVDSRSNAVDLTMSMNQTLELLNSIKDKFQYRDANGDQLSISKQERTDILKLITEFKDDLRIEQVNGRTLGNLAALKAGLDKRGVTSYEEFRKKAMISLDLI